MASENELEKNTRKKKLTKKNKTDIPEFSTLETEEDEVDIPKSSTTENEQNTLDIELPTEKKEYGVLVIDDQIPWHSLYRNNLLKNSQYKFKIYTAKSTTRGIQLITENYGNIQVVILDLNMPRKSGIVFLETLIGEIGVENLGIFIVTSYGTSKALEECMFYGIRGFYDKDNFSFAELSENIIKYIDFINRKTGIEKGIYIEDRYQPQQDRNVLYMRWIEDNGEHTITYLGETNKIETIRLPVRTDLSVIKNFKKDDKKDD